MVDLRNYKKEVREILAKASVRDENWKWSVKSCTKNKISIYWSYLGYIGGKEKMFNIELEKVCDTETNEHICYLMTAVCPVYKIIGLWDVELDGKEKEGRFGHPSIEGSLESAVNTIVSHALNVY